MNLERLREKTALDADVVGNPNFNTFRLNKIINDAQKQVQTELVGLGVKVWGTSNELILSDSKYAGVSTRKANVNSSNFPNLLKTPNSIHRIVCDDEREIIIERQGTYDTNGQGLYTSLSSPQGRNPLLYYYKGTYERTYFLYGNDNNDSNMTSAVTAYDHETNMWLTEHLIAAPIDDNSHNFGAIYVNEDGYILVAQGKEDDGAVRVYKSDSPEDITSFTIESEFASYTSYYHFIKHATNGNLYLTTRGGQPGQPGRYLDVYRSTDKGNNWTNNLIGEHAVEFDVPEADEFWAYHTVDHGKESRAAKYIAINARKGDPTYSFQYIYFLKTYDFKTYYNVDQTWSKDVANDSPITKSELDNHCLVISNISDTESYLRAVNITDDENSLPVLLCQDGVFKGGAGEDEFQITATFLMKWDGLSWTRKNIKDDNNDYVFVVSGSPGDYEMAINMGVVHGLVIHDDGVIDVYGKRMYGDTGSSDGIHEQEIWRSSDGGDSWTRFKKLTENSSYEATRATITSNYKDAPYHFSVMSRKTSDGSYDIEYSVLKYEGRSEATANYGVAYEVSPYKFNHYITNEFMKPTWGSGSRNEAIFAWMDGNVFIFPSDIQNAVAYYQKVVADLSNDSDETEVPSQFQYLIVQKAVAEIQGLLGKEKEQLQALNEIDKHIKDSVASFQVKDAKRDEAEQL